MIPGMETNYIDATPAECDPVPAYAHETIALLNHVEAVEDEIGALIGDTERSRNAQISDRHREIGTGLKLAEIYSTLAIAEAIDKLRAEIRHFRGNPLTAADVPYPPTQFLSGSYADGDPHR